MTRTELVDLLAAHRGLPRRAADAVVDAFFDGMRDALLHGERIEIRGFGSFRLRHYGGYRGTHPRTGQPIDVRPKVLPVFRVGKALQERINARPG